MNESSFPTADLGHIDEAVLVCGGAYSNLEALTALLAAARALFIPARRIIHTGDAVAYCADPEPTAALLREAGMHAIQGNVEESLGESLADCQCGFAADSACDRMAAEWFAYADDRVGVELRAWMAALPHHLTFVMAGRRVRVVHGSATSINRFMFASLPEAEFEAELDAAGADIVVAGHTGIPFTRSIDARVWHNSGALGMPANDGTPRCWFSVLAPDAGGIRIGHHALDYDHKSASRKMAGLSPGYARALVTGLWPSLDVLPAAERRATGVTLSPGHVFASKVPETV